MFLTQLKPACSAGHMLVPCTVVLGGGAGVSRSVTSGPPARASDDGLELVVRQLVDCHDLVQLLGVPGLVLHEVRDANFLHLSEFLEPLHVLVRHLSQQVGNTDRAIFLLLCIVKVKYKKMSVAAVMLLPYTVVYRYH